jgi:hypothetical protein
MGKISAMGREQPKISFKQVMIEERKRFNRIVISTGLLLDF